jgi:hypothetical protein
MAFLVDLRTSTTQFLEGTTRLLSLPIPIRSVISALNIPPRLLPLLLHPTQRTTDQRPVAVSRYPTNPSLVQPIDPLGPPQRTLSRRRPKRFSSASLAYSPDPFSRPSSLPSKTSRTPTTRPPPSRLTLRNPSLRDQTHRPLRPRPYSPRRSLPPRRHPLYAARRSSSPSDLSLPTTQPQRNSTKLE